MNDNFIQLNNKIVRISEPYRAPVGEIVGRVEEIRCIMAAWFPHPETLPLSPMLIGEPGTGKNRIIYECANNYHKDLYMFLGHEDVTAEDMVCSVRFSDHPDRKMDYKLSALATAMILGGVCFIDEIGKIRPRALALLASVLDERRYIDSVILGERIHAHPDFRFVAATNLHDMDGYQLPDFVRSRLKPVIELGPATREEIDKIVATKHSELKARNDEALTAFWDLWEKKDGAKSPSPREAIQLFTYALHLAWSEQSPSGLKTKHLERAFETFYKQREASA